MKKALLIIAWIVILTGLAFIGYHLLNRDTAPETSGKNNQTGQTNTVNENEAEGNFENNNQIPAEINNSNNNSNPIGTVELIPKTFSGHVEAGDEDLSGDYVESAIREYEAAYEINPLDSELLVKLADAYSLNNQYENAKRFYLQAQKLEIDSFSIYLRIIQSHLNLREIENAKSILAQLDQTHPQVRYYNGIIQVAEDNVEGARNSFQSLVEANLEQYPQITQYSQAFISQYENFEFFTEANPLMLETGLAKALTEVNQFPLAILVTNRILDQQSNYRDAWLIQGYSYLNIGLYPEAIDALEQARSLDPENPNVLFFLGMSQYANGNTSEALTLLEEAEENGFIPREDLNRILSEIYIQVQDFQSAATSLKTIVDNGNGETEDYIKLVWLNIDHLKKASTALVLAQKNQKQNPEDAMSYNLLGWAYLANNQIESARTNLQKAIEIDPRLEVAYYNFGRLYQTQGSTITARQYYRQAIEAAPNSEIATLAARQYQSLTHDQSSNFLKANITNSNF